MTTKRGDAVETTDISRLAERQARSESNIESLQRGLENVNEELGGMNTTLGAIEKAVVGLASQPQPKGAGENIRTIATTVAIVATICSAIWWAILTATAPISKQVVETREDVRISVETNIRQELQIQTLEKRLNKLDQFEG